MTTPEPTVFKEDLTTLESSRGPSLEWRVAQKCRIWPVPKKEEGQEGMLAAIRPSMVSKT